jgi:ppGpp synthetase/RelA/SpoT-type nucleotidyltranferase
MNKYQKIDREKLSPKGKALYDKLKKKSNNFEDTDGKLGEILEAFYNKTQTKPAKAEPKKPAKSKPKSKSKVKPKTKAKPKAKKKTTKKTTKSKSGNTGAFAKLRAEIAKRDGITYKQALPIAKKEYAKQKESITKKKRTKTESRLSAYKRKYKGRGTEDVKERGKLRPLDVKKDSKIPALPRGKRVSKGTGANQYGKAKKGRVYYENRSNRTDVRQPSKKVAPPKLAKGGRLNQEQKIYLKDLFYNVRDKEDNRIKKTFNKLDELGVSFRIQNKVIALAEESRTKNLNADDVTKLLSKYAKGGEVEKYIIVRGTKEGEKYYYQKGTNEYDYKWLRSKKDATIFDNIKQAEKAADESDGDIVILGTYAKGGRINIVNEGVKFDKKKYKGILGDFDKDGVANIDDAKPLTKTGKIERVEQVELSKTFERLLKLKSQLDSTMNVAIDELDKVAPDGAQIYARTKTPYSIMKKLVEKRLTDKNKGLTDLVGTTIAVDDYKDLVKVDKEIKKGAIGKVVERENMYDSPKGGYRAIHYLVEADGYIIEVQLKTKRQKDVNVLSHNPYKKGTINKKYLLELTNLANKADKGNKNAIKEFNKIMKDKEKVERQLDTSYEFGGEIRRDYDVNINSGVGTYAKGGELFDADTEVQYDHGGMLSKGGNVKAMQKIRLPKSFSDKYMPSVKHIYFDKSTNKYYFIDFEGDLMEVRNEYTLEKLKQEGIISMAKGGKTDDTFIQDAVEEMKKKGTVGAFTKQAKRREMTPVEFAKMVLKKPQEYSEKTRQRAQFVKNANPELFSFGGEIRRDYDVNINSGVGTYARGGTMYYQGDLPPLIIFSFDDKSDADAFFNDAKYSMPDNDIVRLSDNSIQFIGSRQDADFLSQRADSYDSYNKFAEGGKISDAGDVDHPNQLLNYAKGGEVRDGSIFEITGSKIITGSFTDDNRIGFLLETRDGEDKTLFIDGKKDGTLDVRLSDGINKIIIRKQELDFAKGGNIPQDAIDEFYQLRYDDLDFAEQYGEDDLREWYEEQFARGGKTQGYNARLDESLGDRTGAEIDFEQKKKDRRDESKAMEKARGKRAYSSVRTMDRKKKTYRRKK